MALKHVVEKIREMTDVVESDPRSRGVLSTSERIAVAIVLRRMDWLREDGFENWRKRSRASATNGSARAPR